MVNMGGIFMKVGKALKQLRGNKTQQQLAFEFNVSRESVSAYETERAKLPSDISQKVMEKYDNPWFAMTLASEYTGGAWVQKLDGQYVDLHRSSVAMKTREELHEAIEALDSVCFVNHPRSLSNYKLQEMEEALIQAIDAIVALNHLVAVTCEEYGFSWSQLWDKHTKKLLANGYIQQESYHS
jgi:transcriptional regulator with XRE-family HTH domain